MQIGHGRIERAERHGLPEERPVAVAATQVGLRPCVGRLGRAGVLRLVLRRILIGCVGIRLRSSVACSLAAWAEMHS